MPIVGIVAEYNPFHNGHRYQLQQAKQLTSADAVVSVMSGNFVQRGAPAAVSKWARAEMALKGGADLVFELPFCFAVRSAYNFARGAVKLLAKTGVVTHICFGAETPDLELLQQIAAITGDEPEDLRINLKEYLAQGNSYPLARARALCQYFQRHYQHIDSRLVFNALTGPNNILAVEYLRVIREEKLPLIPVLVPRRGPNYHDLSIHRYASATAIRHCLGSAEWEKQLSGCLPDTTTEILRREFLRGRGPVLERVMEPVLLLLRRIKTAELADIYDVTEGLENRIKKAARESNSLAELKNRIKTKRYNLTRINRILLYVVMNVTKSQIRAFDQTGPTYLRLLGFSPSGQKILPEIKSNCGIFLITRAKEINKFLPRERYPVTRQMLDLDFLATDIFSLFFAEPERQAGKDYRTPPVFIT